MKEIVAILIGAVLINNLVLSRFLGIHPALGASKDLRPNLGVSAAVVIVMCVSAAVIWPVYTYILAANGLEYLSTLIFIMLVVIIAQLAGMAARRFAPALYKPFSGYMPSVITNCAVLGLVLLNVDGYTFWQAMANAFGAGIGFLLAMVLFAGVREKLDNADIPKWFKGAPITLIAASIVSVAFMGFAGIADKLM